MAEGLPQVDIDLAALPLFSVLTSTELDAVTQEFDEGYAQPGERALRQGFAGTGFHVVVSGEAEWRVGGQVADHTATRIGCRRSR